MERDPPQPPGPPRDATQRWLRVVLNGFGFALVVLLPLSFVAAIIAWIVFPVTTTGDYLLHVCWSLIALLCLRLAIVGVVMARAPTRLRPKLLASLARRTSRPQRMGQLFAWAGAWLATYFGASVALFPRPPFPHILPPSMTALVMALPIMLVIALGPIIAHRARERRHRSSASQ